MIVCEMCRSVQVSGDQRADGGGTGKINVRRVIAAVTAYSEAGRDSIQLWQFYAVQKRLPRRRIHIIQYKMRASAQLRASLNQ